MHALFAHKSLQITFLPCICLFRGRVFPSPPAHDDGTVRRHAACSPLEDERGGRCEKLPVSVQLPPCFLPSHRHPARCPPRHRSRLRRRADAATKHCTQSANTPLVQLHAMTVHNAKQNRIIGKRRQWGRNEKEPPLPNPSFRRREAADGGGKTGISRGITPLISVVQWHCPKGVYTTPTPLLCNCTQ